MNICMELENPELWIILSSLGIVNNSKLLNSHKNGRRKKQFQLFCPSQTLESAWNPWNPKQSGKPRNNSDRGLHQEKINSYTTFVKNTIPYCESCSFWDHHRRNWFEIVQTSPRGSWQNWMRAQRWAPVHDVATPIVLCSCYKKCWLLQLYNSSEFAASHVTISSVTRITLVMFKWRHTSVFPKSCFLRKDFPTVFIKQFKHCRDTVMLLPFPHYSTDTKLTHQLLANGWTNVDKMKL